MSEEWLPISGYEGLYEVSSNGRIRSIDRIVSTKSGGTKRLKGRVLKQFVSRRGYSFVILSQNGKTSTREVHRLTALAFVLNPDGKPWALHVNGISLDNGKENLYWGTPSENSADAIRHGTNRNSRKTHCIRGHALTDENIVAADRRRGRRGCLKCSRLYKQTALLDKEVIDIESEG